MIKLRHIGDGVEIHCPSGLSYIVMRDEVIDLMPSDAQGLIDHPQWEVAYDDHDIQDNSEEEE